MESKDSKLYPGIAREPGTFGTPDPKDPTKLIVTTSHPAPYTRKVAVYVPKQYVPGTIAPFMVGADGPARGNRGGGAEAGPRLRGHHVAVRRGRAVRFSRGPRSGAKRAENCAGTREAAPHGVVPTR